MKLFILGFLLALWLPQLSTAATVLLQFDSIIEGIELGPAPPTGTAIHVNIFYETPKDPNVTSEPETTYFFLDAITSVTVGDRAYSMQFMGALIGG